MYTCKEVATLLSQDVDGELSSIDRTKLQAHLAICDACTRVKRHLQLLNIAVGRRKTPTVTDSAPALSDASKDRLKSMLRDAAEKSSDSSEDE